MSDRFAFVGFWIWSRNYYEWAFQQRLDHKKQLFVFTKPKSAFPYNASGSGPCTS